MNTQWQVAEQLIELHRYPKAQHDKSLQAWDSADEYIVQYAIEQLTESSPQADMSVLLVNDLFGAMAVALNNFQPTVITDSQVTKLAIAANCKDNHLPEPRLLDSLSPWPKADLVLIKLTKNLGYLEYQLQQLNQLSQPCQVVAAGKTTMVTSNVMKLFERYLGKVSTSLAKKKSRLIFAEHSPTATVTYKEKYPIAVTWPERELTILSHANVFAKEQIDIGGRFLADHLPKIEDGQRVIDLGCGNGLLGLACLQQLQRDKVQAQICFSDESFMAVESARLNVENQFAEQATLCQFIQDDGLSTQQAESADLILCNPPFHQQNTITEHIALQMFEQAYRTLTIGGQFLVVANRHLAYAKPLKKLFGGFRVLAQNNKFVIFQCNKNN